MTSDVVSPDRPLPLKYLPSDVLSAVRGLVFHIDDTVTKGGRLEPQALDAMFRLEEAGLKLVAVTGRPLGWVDVLVRLLDADRIGQLTRLIEAEGARSTVSSVHAHAVPGDWDKAKGVRRGLTDALGVDLAA